MKQPPKPRPRIYDLYWYFAAERQAIFERRVNGLPKPWSEDPILKEYKFCSVYRAADRVSQYMIRNVACDFQTDTLDDQLFQIVAFRTFSRIETWETVREILGHPPTISDLNSGMFAQALEATRKQNRILYTGA